MKYYKVVRGNLQSAFINGRWQVQYQIGTWVRAPELLVDKGYGLTVFNSLKDARHFIAMEKGTKRLFTCQIRVQMQLSSFCIVEIVSERIPPPSNGFYSWPWPLGTVMCEEVKLVREIPVNP